MYKLLPIWHVIDFICTYSHIVINVAIVVWSIQFSVSLYFAINVTFLVTFYVNCIREVTKIEKHADKGEKKFDLQAASDLCRDYKKKYVMLLLN